MKKHWQIFKISWQNTLVYRFNLIMFQVRILVSFLGIYWLWRAVFSQYLTIGSYDQSTILGYLLTAWFLRSLVFSNISFNACVEIANGDLNNYLLKPVGYLKNWLMRDWADKTLNLIFFAVELSLLLWAFHLSFPWPKSFIQGLAFFMAAMLAALLYFFFSFVVSAFAFWYPEHDGWPLRFLMLMLLEFMVGTAFPLDILPPALLQIFKVLPFFYFIFYPAQIYLGRLSGGEILSGGLIMLAWLTALIVLTKLIWRKGLTIYGAYGR